MVRYRLTLVDDLDKIIVFRSLQIGVDWWSKVKKHYIVFTCKIVWICRTCGEWNIFCKRESRVNRSRVPLPQSPEFFSEHIFAFVRWRCRNRTSISSLCSLFLFFYFLFFAKGSNVTEKFSVRHCWTSSMGKDHWRTYRSIEAAVSTAERISNPLQRIKSWVGNFRDTLTCPTPCSAFNWSRTILQQESRVSYY